MAENNESDYPAPLSEVGSVLAGQENSSVESDRWRVIFEQQNANMRALIEALQTPKTKYQVDLPVFDPDGINTDARSWCATADLCFDENPLHGGQLILSISKALKGAASTWLSQIAYQGMTWEEFKSLFTARFVSSETLAGTLVLLNNDKPADKETLVAYASRVMTSLMNRWKDADKEQIAVATVLAHISQFDTRLQRLVFTTDITSRDRLQKELHAFSHLKRKIGTPGDSSSATEAKRAKISSLRCYNCDKVGHRQSECRIKPVENIRRLTMPAPPSQAIQRPLTKSLVCFKCGQPGHIAIRCTSGSGPADGQVAARNERRVDVCVVQAPSGTLEHKRLYTMANESSCISKYFEDKDSGYDSLSIPSPKTSFDTSQDLSQNSITSESDFLSLSQLDIEEPEPFRIEPFYNITPREMPISPHYVIEEEFSSNPWALLIATIFLTKTSAKTARPYMRDFFNVYPSPYHVIDVPPNSLEKFFETLGLRKRGHMIWKLSYQFVSSKWRRASDLCGIGKYGEDAYRIFCLGHTDLDPGDRYLKLYSDWLRRQTDFSEDNGVIDSEYVIEDPVLKYYRVTLRDCD